MVLIVNDHDYILDENHVRGVLEVAKKQIKRGIYAIEKGMVVELKNEIYNSKDKLEKAVGKYSDAGYKVYYEEG